MMLAQQIQDGLSRPGDLAVVLAQLGRQLGEIGRRRITAMAVLMLVMRLTALAHEGNGWLAFRFLVNKRITSVNRNRAMQDIAMVAPQGALK